MLREFHIFPGHFPGHPGCFFGFSTHPWDMYCILTCGGPMLFRIFSHQIMCVHPADALKILELPATFTWTWGCFFLGFGTSWRCSRNSTFSQDIYPDAGVFSFGYYAHYIMQMLQIFLGHLPRHRGCFFRLFHTLHHPAAPAFLGTFTQTWELFFLGFLHTTSCRCASFSWDIYTDMVVFFLWAFRTLHHADAILSIPPLIPARIQEFQRIPARINRNPNGIDINSPHILRFYFRNVLEEGNWPK